MENEDIMNAVSKIKLSLNELDKCLPCPAEDHLISCKDCKFIKFCDLMYEMQTDANNLYYVIANVLGEEYD